MSTLIHIPALCTLDSLEAAAPGCLEHAICQTPETAAATCAELSGSGERISIFFGIQFFDLSPLNCLGLHQFYANYIVLFGAVSGFNNKLASGQV